MLKNLYCRWSMKLSNVLTQIVKTFIPYEPKHAKKQNEMSAQQELILALTKIQSDQINKSALNKEIMIHDVWGAFNM